MLRITYEILVAESKKCIASSLHFCEQEHDNGTFIISVTAIRECVVAMANVNLSTVTSIWQSLKNYVILSSPKRKRSRNRPITAVDDGTQLYAIKNTIYQI